MCGLYLDSAGFQFLAVSLTSHTEALRNFRHYKKTAGCYFKLGHHRFPPNQFILTIHCYNRQIPLAGNMASIDGRYIVGLPTRMHIKDY